MLSVSAVLGHVSLGDCECFYSVKTLDMCLLHTRADVRFINLFQVFITFGFACESCSISLDN